MRKVDWSTLPVELLGVIALRLFSVVEVLRFRSICKSWRSSVSGDENPLPPRPVIQLNPLVMSLKNIEQISGFKCYAFLSRASFLRVTLSSSSSSSSVTPGKGWLIKSDKDFKFGELIHLVNPLSRHPLQLLGKYIDLLHLTVSEIREAYAVKFIHKRKTAFGFKRVVLVKDHTVLGVGNDGKIRYWNGVIWTRLKDQVAKFSDIIVHGGLTYALDSHGIVWWISSSLSIYRYGPSLHENINTNHFSEKSLVECCGELYIVDRLRAAENLRRKRADTINDNGNGNHPRVPMIHDNTGNEKCKLSDNLYPKTLGFKVYKMDEDLGKWVEVKSLGDNAFLMATDSCFSVSAHDFYGCLQNAIYFTDEEDYEMKVFKLDDGSIITKNVRIEQTCFQMFAPPFLSYLRSKDAY